MNPSPSTSAPTGTLSQYKLREQENKIRFLNSVFLLACVVSLIMGFIRWQDSVILGAIDLCFSAISLGLLIYLKYNKEKIETISFIAIISSFLLFTSIYFIAPLNTTRFALFFLLIASVFFLKGRQQGRLWLILVLAGVIFSALLQKDAIGYSHLDIFTLSIYLIALFGILENYETYKEKQREFAREKDALQLTEERWRLALEGSGDAIWHWNIATDKFQYSKRFAEILGFNEKHQDKKHKQLIKQIFENDKTRIRSNLASYKKNEEEHYLAQQRVFLQDGTQKWLLCRGRVTSHDPVGNPIHMAGTYTDITDRIQAEQALQESERRLQMALNSAHMGVWEYDLASGKLFISHEAYPIFNFAPAEQDLVSLQQFVHPEDLALVRSIFIAARSEHRNFTIEFRLMLPNGQIRWAAGLGQFIFNDLGEAVRVVGTIQDITERKYTEEEIRQLAFFDPLTRLPNRRLLMDRLSHARISSTRDYEFGALLILDMDHFKSLNDTQGHDVGDRLLIEVANRLKSCVRQTDTVSRLGGDEYVVILEVLGKTERAAAKLTEQIAEKIRQALNQPYFLHHNSELEYRCTPSIGVTLFLGKTASTESLLKQADVALYQAKDAGRNAVRFFNPTMQAAIDARTRMETALLQALENGEFHLYYQPQFNHNNQLVGAEALLRWLRQDGTWVLPADFIPLAEETGLILPIGQWVLDTACAQLKHWQEDVRMREISLSINVSARQFHQPDFVAQISRSLDSAGIDPSRIKLELTESVLLKGSEEVIDSMQKLSALGVGFALDDFGMGYSSLSYIKRLPIRQLKIDQSFIRDITHDASDAAIVSAILAMSQSLGIDAIAEGVENTEQRDFLLSNNCSLYQGNLFGVPMPAAEWEAFLLAREASS